MKKIIIICSIIIGMMISTQMDAQPLSSGYMISNHVYPTGSYWAYDESDLILEAANISVDGIKKRSIKKRNSYEELFHYFLPPEAINYLSDPINHFLKYVEVQKKDSMYSMRDEIMLTEMVMKSANVYRLPMFK